MGLTRPDQSELKENDRPHRRRGAQTPSLSLECLRAFLIIFVPGQLLRQLNPPDLTLDRHLICLQGHFRRAAQHLAGAHVEP